MDPLTRAIRTLTIAVWCLCALVFAQLALWGWSYLRSWQMFRSSMGSVASSSSSTSPVHRPPAASSEEPDGPLHDLPPEQMVARSSVILLTSYEKDGDRFKAVVTEILKQKPGTRLYYSVGDEMPMLSYAPKANETCGDGQVVFMAGSPASMRSSYSFREGRIGGMGDLPLTTLREMILAVKS
jgi:hypothetical protein